jgi:hypothetical protein
VYKGHLQQGLSTCFIHSIQIFVVLHSGTYPNRDMNWSPFLDLCNIKDKSMFIPMGCKIKEKDSIYLFFIHCI